jgi:hypothetical protein
MRAIPKDINNGVDFFLAINGLCVQHSVGWLVRIHNHIPNHFDN